VGNHTRNINRRKKDRTIHPAPASESETREREREGLASAIRSAAGLRHRLPRLLSSTARSTPRALEEERQFMGIARRAGLPSTGDPRPFSSAVGKCYKHPCKFNRGPMGMEGKLASINRAVKDDALGWRAIREQLEVFQQNETKRAEVYKRQDRVVAYASAAVALALVAANVHSD